MEQVVEGEDKVEAINPGHEPGTAATEPGPPVGSLTYAAAGCVVGMFLTVLFGGVAFQITGDDSHLLVTAGALFGLWLGLLGAAFVASRRHGTGSLARDFGVRITWGDLWLGLLGGIGVQALVSLIYLPFSELNSELSAPARSLAEQAPTRASELALAAMVVIGAPLVEEIFFRGVLMGALRRFGTGVAVVVSAAVFALVHVQPLAIPALVVLGVVLGLLAIGRRRLGPAIVTHAVFNAITMAVLLFPPS